MASIARKKNGRRKSPAFTFISDSCIDDPDACEMFDYPQDSISFGGLTKSPRWIACYLAHGSPPPGMVPVPVCGVPGCINGHHFKWGTQAEVMAKRRFKNRTGSRNPNAKLTWEKVRAIRSLPWGKDYILSVGYVPGKTIGTILKERKEAVAAQYGIAFVTLERVLRGKLWPAEDDPLGPAGDNDGDSINTDGDEF